MLILVCASPSLAPAATSPAGATIRDGNARFQVITPTLIRLEYSADGRFEDRPSMTVASRGLRPPRYTLRTRGGVLEIRTGRMTLRYRQGSGAFAPENLSLQLRIGSRVVVAQPRFGPPPSPSVGPPSLEVSPYTVREDPGFRARTAGNLGGWYRGLDLAAGPVPLHDGVLSRDGWYLLDDSHTVLLQDQAPGYAVRPGHGGAYQDGYLFGYGHDYARGLADLRTLTGAAPLLPRQAFGVWFSRYFAYRQDDYPLLLARFRAERVPLDVLMVDTDFKAPHAWNGWGWNPRLFPDPSGFLAWAHRAGIQVSLNTHPSITTDDPRLAEAETRAGHQLPPDPTGLRCRTFVSVGDAYGTTSAGVTPDCRVFDWARAGDQEAYFELHAPFERQGLDFWWLDYCCDESYALAPGLTQDTWINHLYAKRSRARGSRWPVLSRVGASVFDPDAEGPGIWAEHRNAIHFTGDARPTWPMLDFQTVFTTAEGNVGIPYVSHDIGGFGAVTTDGTTGRHLPDDLYVRWVQSGAFQPILRLHSDHGDRLPWDYPGKAQQIATRFLRLRGALNPYLYTLARQAHDTGLPMARGMYLRWPQYDDAYAHDRQYMLGADMLVAPVGTPGDPSTKRVWFPPGQWVDYFTGERLRGPVTRELTVPLERMPLFVRAGAVVPTQSDSQQGSSQPPNPLIVTAFSGADGAFRLYEDEWDGLGYSQGRFSRTRLVHDEQPRAASLAIGPARGRFPGRPSRRRYEVRFAGVPPARVATVGGRRARRVAPGAARGWWYETGTRTLVVRTGSLPTRRPLRVTRGIPCLARRYRVTRRGIGPVRLGPTRRALFRRAGAPRRSGRRALRWCALGGGRVVATSARHPRLVATTARGHRVRAVGPGSSLERARRAFPRLVRLASGLYSVRASSPVLLGVRSGRVRFIVVVAGRDSRSPGRVRRQLRRAGIR